MFSKRRQPKTEFFGIIRNIFSSGSRSVKKNNGLSTETKQKDKDTMKKTLKSKFSLTRMGSRKFESKGTSQVCQQNIFSPASNLHFDEVDMTLTSIIKDPRTTSIVSHKKKLRFENNVTQQTSVEDLSILTNAEIENKDSDTFNDSDDDYYKRMKNDLLSRNKKAPFPKPKRTKSFKNAINEAEDTDTEQAEETAPKEYQNSDNKFEDIGRVFSSEQIKKWQNGFTDIYHNDSYHNIFASEDLNTDLIMNSMKHTEFLSSFEESAVPHTSGKIATAKMSKKNRFDPVSRNENCGVALLKKMDKDSNRMSWCSVSSF